MLLIGLQLITILSSGVFAAIGLMSQFRDESGRITKVGRWALGGTLVSLCSAAAFQVMDFKKQQREEAKRDIEIKSVLCGIQSSLNPVENIYLDYLETEFKSIDSESSTALKAYAERLKRALPIQGDKKGILNIARAKNGSPKWIMFDKDSELFPTDSNDVFSVAEMATVDIYIYRAPRKYKPFDNNDWKDLEEKLGPPDIAIRYSPEATRSGEYGGERSGVSWDIQSGSIGYFADNFRPVNGGLDKSSSKITSIMDLPGSQIWFIIAPPDRPTLLRNILSTVSLDVTGGYKIEIDYAQSKRYETVDGSYAYEYIVPKDWAPARGLCKQPAKETPGVQEAAKRSSAS